MPTKNPNELKRLKARDEAVAAAALNQAESDAAHTLDVQQLIARIDALEREFAEHKLMFEGAIKGLMNRCDTLTAHCERLQGIINKATGVA